MEHLWPAWSFSWPTDLLPIIAKLVFSAKFNFESLIYIISSRIMSAGGDSGEGSTPARGPRPYEWHLMQALMPRHFGPFDPAMFSRNAEQILRMLLQIRKRKPSCQQTWRQKLLGDHGASTH